MVICLCFYEDDPNKTIEMLNFLKGPQPLSAYEIQFLRDRLAGKGYLPYSYFVGASPENSYSPSKPYQLEILEDPYSYAQEGYAKLSLRSSGADSVRHIKLRKKADQWFLWENYLLADIRKPQVDDSWA